MQHERTFSEELKHQFNHGGMHIRLIFINLSFFVLIKLLMVFGKLTMNSAFDSILYNGFTLQTDFDKMAWLPLGLITNMFSHIEFLHFALNMLFLYLVGGMFRQFFTDRRLLHVYIVGGLFGGVFELVAHWVFPIFIGQNSYVLGASGAVMALLFAIIVYRPNLQVNLFGIIPVRLFWLGIGYIVIELVQMIGIDKTAHFAHIGGAIVGALSVANLYSSSNIINQTEKWHQQILTIFKNRKSKTHLKAEKGGARMKSDEAYNMSRKENQEQIDKILDKISKSGYESLTKAEKEFLFSQGKK